MSKCSELCGRRFRPFGFWSFLRISSHSSFGFEIYGSWVAPGQIWRPVDSCHTGVGVSFLSDWNPRAIEITWPTMKSFGMETVAAPFVRIADDEWTGLTRF